MTSSLAASQLGTSCSVPPCPLRAGGEQAPRRGKGERGDGAPAGLARHFTLGCLQLQREDKDQRYGAMPQPQAGSVSPLLQEKDSGTLSEKEKEKKKATLAFFRT